MTPPPVADATVADELDPAIRFDRDDETKTVASDEELSDDLSLADVDGSDDKNTPPRVRQWMNSLLDLSTRNQLLSLKIFIIP